MPYIPKAERKDYNQLIDDIVDKLLNKFPGENGKGYSEGDLNYIISSIVWKIFNKNKSYSNGNKLIGVLECVKLELYRRQISIYEDEKMNQNGDLEITPLNPVNKRIFKKYKDIDDV